VILSGARLTIGRRSLSRGIEPDIDLSGPPPDPGVSVRHALLLACPGGWELVDLDSTNGTTVGDATEPVPPNTPVALAHGDRIKLGAWTIITITCSALLS
jgi:pSer/pThr/pTyr-binding forkhead associated (FHA) protein